MISPGFSEIALVAETHPAGYSFHKYWARKPHNVVRRVLESCGVGPGSVVLDPFCGSGVPLSEAAALGADGVGFDVNPVAVALTRVTLAPPDASRFHHALAAVVDEAEAMFGARYTVGGRRIRYAVHATVVVCTGCSSRVPANHAERRGRSYVCPTCQVKLGFNLERLVATRPLRLVFDDGTQHELLAEDDADRGAGMTPDPRFDHPITHNPRLLAYDGMRTSHLFTARNFAVLSHVARHIESLPSDIRPAARLTLTAAVAQCSRLIAHRNGLSTGGPAWTVPGFWVPPIHLENNPLQHLRTRMRRTFNGLKHLHAMPGRGSHHVVLEGEAGRLLATAPMPRPADVVFFDPPYGDSVPYLEFSAMWNGFLGQSPDPGLDLAVSNRARGDGSWAAYEHGLRRIVSALMGSLAGAGKVIVTFNNKDKRAWKALLGALQGAGLRCDGAFYQAPAVVSTKARLAHDGSYLGDVYGVFVRSEAPTERHVAAFGAALSQEVAAQSNTADNEALVARLAVLTLLRGNADANCFESLDALVRANTRVRH